MQRFRMSRGGLLRIDWGLYLTEGGSSRSFGGTFRQREEPTRPKQQAAHSKKKRITDQKRHSNSSDKERPTARDPTNSCIVEEGFTSGRQNVLVVAAALC